jgi:AAA ATPase domain
MDVGLKFGIKNLRRLKDVPPVELKPITLLVGRNSSGKSSFLRLFPLLRQSLMTRTSSPILWYGDLVDFGTYSTAVSNLAQDEEITFSFVLDRVQVNSDIFWIDEDHYQSTESEHLDVEFDITIGPGQGERSTVRKLALRSREPRVMFELVTDHRQHVEKLTVDGLDVALAFAPQQFGITVGSILPEMFLISPEADARTVVRRRRGEGEIARAIFDLLRPLFPKNFNETQLLELCTYLMSLRALDADKLREGATRTTNKRWNKLIAVVTQSDHPFYANLRGLLAVAVLSDLLRRVDQQLRSILSGVLYIGPARARSERYYRYQDLSVSEIDPDGKNFPMFLNSLPNYQITRLSNWVESLFGYGVSIRREGGHISIDLTAKGNISNIVDTGYGVSQILPVLGQIWWARSRPSTPALRQAQVSILAIEQPELHLHPAHQALLADALVGEVGLSPEFGRNTDARIHFLIETHSETLINRLGELVHAGRLNHADVQIIMFEPDPSGEHLTTIRTSSFNESGELVDWPFGFFQPSIV